MSQASLERREREKEQRKQGILDVALSLFSRRGFHNVSMQEVAEDAGFGVGTLYNFFDGKEALFDELHNRAHDQVLDALLKELQGPGTEVERLRRFMQCQPVILMEHGDFIRLYVAEMGQRVNKLCAGDKNNAFRAVLESELARVIQSAIDRGLFRQVDAGLAAKAIASTMETIAFEDSGSLNRQQHEETFARAEAFFIDGLLVAGDSSNHA